MGEANTPFESGLPRERFETVLPVPRICLTSDSRMVMRPEVNVRSALNPNRLLTFRTKTSR